MCLDCQIRMEDGDHGACSIEFLACPDHRGDQLRGMGFVPGGRSAPEHEAEDRNAHDKERTSSGRFCFWWGQTFDTVEEMDTHNADTLAQCTVYQQHRRE
jgi:hypothetical protein